VRSRIVAVRAVVAVIACLVVVGAVLVASATPVHAQAQPRRVLVYGDSLTWEAQAGIEQDIEAQLPGWDAIVRTFPGAATCDALPAMRADGNLNVGVVVIEYVGVPFGPCMAGKDALAQHTADTQTALALWASRGVPVVLVGAPRGVGEPREANGAAAINRDLAARAGQAFVDAGVLLRDPWTGVYQQRRACLEGEGAAQGCGADGLVDVRDETGGHFCAIHNVGPCPAYASGIVRFAASITDAVVRAAGLHAVAPLPGPAPAPEVHNAARALFVGTGTNTVAPTDAPPSRQQATDAAVLTSDDVPADLGAQQAGATTTAAVPLADPACRAIRSTVKTLDRAARAEATFVSADRSASVDEFVQVLPSAKQAKAAYAAYATPKAAACLERVFGVPVSVEPGHGFGDGSVAYRVAAARQLVIEVVRDDRAVAALTFANAVTPPPPDVVAAITKAAVSRTDAALLAHPAR
jgi:hypothetical protein